jgi:chromosome segregation ATPase
VKVEDRSKKGKEAALLTLIILQNGEALGRGVSESRAKVVKSYLKSLLTDIIAENLELDIKAQEEAISKAEKKLESLKREKSELERKIEVNERTQLDTENEIKAKQEGLEILKSKRTTTPVSPGSGSVQKTNP